MPQTLPDEAAVLEWAAYIPCRDPGPWLQREQSRPYSEIILSVLTCVELDEELIQSADFP